MEKFGSVDAYIEASRGEARAKLEELRKLLKSTVPGVEEKISWGVPFYRSHGALGGFAVYKNHVSFGGAALIPAEDRRLLKKKGYATGKMILQIKFDQKVPAAAIRKTLKSPGEGEQSKKKGGKIGSGR